MVCGKLLIVVCGKLLIVVCQLRTRRHTLLVSDKYRVDQQLTASERGHSEQAVLEQQRTAPDSLADERQRKNWVGFM